MSKLRLHGTSSGYTDIAPTAAAGNNTLTAPTGTGTLVIKDGSGAIGITSVQATNANFSGTTRITSGISTTLRVTTGISTTLQVGGVNVLNSDGVNTSGIVTAKTFVPSEGQLSNRNIITNGAMLVAQRGTSTTSSGYLIDRQNVFFLNLDEDLTQAQVDVSSGTDPYNEGFRKALKITNGNQTSGAGSGDRIQPQHKIEAQNVVNSGWNHTDSNSFITLSFWVKSSVAQTYYGYLRTQDGTSRIYTYSVALSANTWTKVVKTIPGNSNIQIDNDNGEGLQWNILLPFIGTDLTDSGVSLNAWNTYAGGTRTPDNTSTWYTTNDSTMEFTGLQAEVGSVTTPFEHRSYGDELTRCQRYYFKMTADADYASGGATMFGVAYNQDTTTANGIIHFPTSMRTEPDALEQSGTANHYRIQYLATNATCNGVPTFGGATLQNARVLFVVASGLTAGQGSLLRSASSSAYLAFSAEL